MDYTEHFLNGLLRVNKIVDSNPRYDLILGERVKTPWYQKILQDNRLDEFELKRVVERRIRNSNKVYQLPDFDGANSIVGIFPTLNNKRERDFLVQALSDESLSPNIIDLSELELTDCSSASALNDNSLIKKLLEFFKTKRKLSASNVHQSVSFLLSFRTAVNTLNKLTGMSLFAVANDHSPLPVAFWAAAKCAGIKTLYLQHAEVTEAFPPLDFDYAVLRNRASREVYKAICNTECKIVFGAREKRPVDGNTIRAKINSVANNKRLIVVIYLTAIFNEAHVVRLAKALRALSNVEEVFLKPHPSFCKLENENTFEGIKILNSHISDPHLAVCGNSSVVLELLEKGNIVVQDFSLDDIMSDYYGFVRKGLVKELDIRALCEVGAQALVNTDSITALTDYLPHLDSKRNRLDRLHFSYFISKLKSTYFTSAKVAPFDFSLAFNIAVTPLTFAQVVNYSSDDWLNDLSMVTELNGAFDDRDVALLNFFPLINFSDTKTAVKFWMQSKRIEWNGCRPSASEFSAMIDFALNNRCERKLKGWLETKAFDLALRSGSYEHVHNVICKSNYFSIKRSPANRIVSFKKFSSTLANQEQHQLEVYLPNESELSPLSKLKLEVQGANDELNTKLHYREIESRFMRAHESIKNEYKERVISAYETIRGREQFIDVKFNRDQRSSLVAEVVESLKAKQGFSFIRLSDGEGFIFREQSEFFSEEDSLNRQRHWWGRELSEYHETQLRRCLFAAVKNADLLGIPSVYRFVRDHSDKTKSLTQNLQGRGLLSVLSALPKIDTPSKRYTDDKANTAVFKSSELLNSLNRLATRTILITSGREKVLVDLFEDKSKLKFIQVPTHQKTSSNSHYTTDELPLPYHLDDLQLQLEHMVTKGTLVLVGAGVAGKVFCDIAKQNSAVGLDLGSVFDELVGGGIHSLF